MACAAVDSLNELYGCTGSHSGIVTAAQDSALTNIVQTVADGYDPVPLQQNARAAYHELLGSKSDYVGVGATVVPFQSELVSLPDNQLKPVPLDQVFPKEVWNQFCLDNILADHDVVRFRRSETVKPYMDEVLRKDPLLYKDFRKRLYRCGVLGFSKHRKSRITPW